jgi:hypothetical protein
MKSFAGLHESTEESTKNLGVRRPWDGMIDRESLVRREGGLM